MDTELKGTWTSPCTANKDGGSFTQSNAYTNTDATETSSAFAETGACTTLMYTIAQSEGYSIGDYLTGSTDTKKIDITLADVQVTVEAGALAIFNKSPGQCGISDWAAGVPRSVLGTKCANNGTAGAVQFNIFQIVGTNLKTGSFSNTLDGSTDAKRPTTLSSSTVMVAQ